MESECEGIQFEGRTHAGQLGDSEIEGERKSLLIERSVEKITESPNMALPKPPLPPTDKSEGRHIINMEELLLSKKFENKKYTDALYEGEIEGGRREGQGVMKYGNGRVYEGWWKNDLRHGKGFEIYSNGNTYEGDFSEGAAHGKGVYTWKNGEIYDGEWCKGLKHGDGVWKGNSGDSYIGEWKSSKADGYGVHIWKNGDRYEGEWKACLKHGNGTDIFANGDVYIGQYKYGKPNGYGQYVWKNESSYTGEFRDGLKHGFGKYRKSKENKSNMYEGQYCRDKKHGFGIFKWMSGNVYKGEYKDDEREGLGEMRWTDGSVYIGEWKRGIQHGYGRMIFPDSTVKDGLFENNVYKGPARQNEILFDLATPDFDIMNIAPREVFFSEEVRSFNPALRPLALPPYAAPATAKQPPKYFNHKRFPTANTQRKENISDIERRDTKYSMPPVHPATRPYPAQNRFKMRSFSKEYQIPVVRQASEIRTRPTYFNYRHSFNNSSKTLGGRLSSKLIQPTNSTTVYTPNSRPSPMRTRVSSHPKQIWRPSGRVHYKDMASQRPRLLG